MEILCEVGSITLNEREARFSQPKLELHGLYRTLCALKILLIGIRNLVVEVDAMYIRGMLKNPDIAPLASINRWILLILMFHFTLVHAPGTHHSPDGLSWRRPQPGDKDESEDDFEDWVDQVNGFMHFVNVFPSCKDLPSNTVSAPPVACYIINATRGASQGSEEEDKPEVIPTTQYSEIPRSDSAKAADLRLVVVKIWHKTLAWPDDLQELSDSEYKSFMCYCTEFFIAGEDDRLW